MKDEVRNTVKVRPVTPDIKRALATRKMCFMISISERRFPGFNDESSYFYRGVEEQDIITWNLVITKGPFNILPCASHQCGAGKNK